MQDVLWLTAEVPDPEFGGSSIREFHLLTEMAKRAHCDLVTPVGFSDSGLRSALRTVFELDTRGPSRPRGLAQRVGDLWWGLTSRDPFEVRDNDGLRKAVSRLGLDYGAYDIVCVEHTGLASLLQPRRANRWVLNLCQLNSRRSEHELPLAPPGRRRWLVARNLERARCYESWAASAYDLVAVASPEDAEALPGTPMLVPNGVDLDKFRSTSLPADHSVLLSASLNTLANVDGARWFCEHVWPRIRQLVPDATLDIVGKQPVPDVRHFINLPGIALHADVPSMVPFLQAARVAVVPLRIGSGTRIKALEAMAAGRPVVGTSIGLEGLDLTTGIVAAADDAELFAQTTADLLCDDPRATQQARSARAEVEANFGWRTIASTFCAAALEQGS